MYKHKMQFSRNFIAYINAYSMAKNFLKLNDSKTEFIIFGTEQNIGKVSEQTVSIGDAKVLPSRTSEGYWSDVGCYSHHEVACK